MKDFNELKFPHIAAMLATTLGLGIACVATREREAPSQNCKIEHWYGEKAGLQSHSLGQVVVRFYTDQMHGARKVTEGDATHAGHSMLVRVNEMPEEFERIHDDLQVDIDTGQDLLTLNSYCINGLTRTVRVPLE